MPAIQYSALSEYLATLPTLDHRRLASPDALLAHLERLPLYVLLAYLCSAASGVTDPVYDRLLSFSHPSSLSQVPSAPLPQPIFI